MKVVVLMPNSRLPTYKLEGRRQKVCYCYVVVSAVNSVLTFMATAITNSSLLRLTYPETISQDASSRGFSPCWLGQPKTEIFLFLPERG